MSAVELIVDGSMAELIMKRPEVLNSLDEQAVEEMSGALREAEASGARGLLLRGEGRGFSAGRDLSTASPLTEDAYAILSGVFNPLIAQLRNLPIPTVAAVHGPCLGVGFGLAMACDVVIAARKSTLGSPFANIGCVLDSGGHLALVHRVGAHRALELIYTAELINGERAEQIGLVNRVVDDEALVDTAREMVMSIAKGPTQALLESKRIISGIIDDGSSLAEVLEAEAAAQGRMAGTPDYVEGITAFLEKRKPTFNGPA